MKRIFFLFLCSVLKITSFAQLNMTLTDQIDYTQAVSSLWGYIDPEDSTEYAAVGTATGLSVVDLSDPNNIVEVAFVPDVNSQWREVKSFGHYIYAVTEGGGGVLVVNMKDAPANVTSTHWAPTIPGLGTLNKIHSIFMDEFGFMYLNGSNLNSGGVIIADVSADDGTPVYVGKAPAVYCHDSYARNNKLYTSDIYVGRFSVYDITDKTNIKLLATQATPYSFTHNIWLNDAGDVLFTTDEKANAPVAAYNISDLNNIVELDQFRPVATIGAGAIPHNVHVWNDWLIVAYYTEGTIIVDGSRPENLIEVGYFDSFVSQTAGFYGVWGVYPYFPSGLVIASDMQNGLLVYDVNYVRACWLEGKVTDVTTGLPISNVSVHIESDQANAATTNIIGDYKTGQEQSGTFQVTFSASGYYPRTLPATLENGVLTVLDVELVPFAVLTGKTVRSTDGTAIPGASIIISGPNGAANAVSNAIGSFAAPGIVAGTYTIYIGAWGYKLKVIENLEINDATVQPLVFDLERGYEDVFLLDLGWTKTTTASTGAWERGEPAGTIYAGQQSNPEFDIAGDVGDKCYMTGNGGGAAADFDVDNGTVTLTSPVMDLSGYNKPILRYNTWFFNDGGNGNPNDALEVRISNGSEEIILETITQSKSEWNAPSEFDLASLITLTNNMQVTFETSDLPNSGHLVEAAVDAFRVDETAFYPVFHVSATESCNPFTVQFNDFSDSTAVWSWTFEGGEPATSDEQNPVVTYYTPGSYAVILKVTTNKGNSYLTERPGLITVHAAPIADFSFGVAANKVKFTHTTQPGDTYEWNFGDGSVETSENPEHTYNSAGIYTVTLTVSNGCGQATFSQQVEILAVPPIAEFSSINTSGCAPFTVQFQDLSDGEPDAWAWNFPGGTPETSTERNPVVVYNAPGSYEVSLAISNIAGSDNIFYPDYIEVGEGPAAGFTYSQIDNQIAFTNISGNATSYEWDFGDNAGSPEENPVHTYSSAGSFDVTLTAMNHCGLAVFTQTINILTVSALNPEATHHFLAASPNPFRDQLMVRYELTGLFQHANLQIFNVLGEKLSDIPLQQNTGFLTLGREFNNSGIYFLRLVADGKVGQTVRVVKM
jgi:choice-of-anchor B domain-containing protein